MESQFSHQLTLQLRVTLSILLLIPALLLAKFPNDDRTVQTFIGNVESNMSRSEWHESSNQMILDNAMNCLTQRVKQQHKLKLLQTSVIPAGLMALYINEVEQEMADASWKTGSEELGLADQINQLYFTTDSNAIGVIPEIPSEEEILQFINAVDASLYEWNSPDYVSCPFPGRMTTGL